MRKYNIAMLSGDTPEPAINTIAQESYGQFAEDSISQANRHYGEISKIQQAMLETEDVALEALEERAALEAACARGGAESVAMEALQRAVKRFEKRTGVAYQKKYLSLESFESKASRMQSTKVAMEATSEYIKKLIKTLSDAVSGIWEKVKAYFEELMVGAERLVKRANKLQVDLESVKGKEVKEDNVVTVPTVLEFARKGNQLVEGEDFVKAYSQHVKESSSYRSADSEFVKDWINKNNYQEILEESKKENNQAKILELIASKHNYPNEVVKGGLQYVEIKHELLGDYVTVETLISKDSTWEELSKNFTKVGSKIEKPQDNEGFTPKSVIALTPEQSEAVLGSAVDLMGSFKELRSQIKMIDAEIKKIIKEAGELVDYQNASLNEMLVASGYVRTHANAMMDKMTTQRGYDVNLTKAALDYVAASIDQIK